MGAIHPSAVIEDGAVLGEGCRIGAFAYVGPQVVLGDHVELKPYAMVTGRTEIGAESTVFSFAVVGEIPQDLKFSGEDTRLEIGARARIREHVTVNTGTEGGGGVTKIGDDVLLMAGCHVAHDAHLGDRVIIVNSSAVAGHCIIEDDVIVGGLCGIHQFVRIGRGAIIGALSMVTKDVIPYGLVQAPRAELDGLNLVGLKRRGADRAEIAALRAALEELRSGEGTFMERAARLDSGDGADKVKEIMAFILGDSDRSFLTPR